MSSAQDSSGRAARSAIDGSALPVASTSRSPTKVAFNDEREEYEYRSRYSDSASSDSEQSTCSTSDASSSADRSRRSHRRRRSERDSCHGRRRHSSDRYHSRNHKPRRPRHTKQGTSSSSATYAAPAFAEPVTYTSTGPAAGASTATPPGPLHGSHLQQQQQQQQPQQTMHGQQGMVCAGPVSVHSYHPDQPLALLPPPGSGPFPGSPSPVSTPTKAYTSPRSAQDPPPTLLLSPYGVQHHHPSCPAAAAARAYGAAGGGHPPAFPGGQAAQHPQLQLPASLLLEPMQTLALNGAAAARAPSLMPSQHPDPGAPPVVQYGTGQAASPVMPPHSYSLPPPPAPLPLSLPEQPQLPYPTAHQHHQARGLSMLYDETMQEVVLADAVMVKELAKQGHALVPLHDAYRAKLAALQATVNGQLLAKREALLHQHARLAARAGEVAARRTALEREVEVLAEDMVGRIRGAESAKQATLGREQADVGAQLDAIQRLLADVMAASAAGPVDFLNAYSRLSDTCARLVSRPFKQVVEVAADDLPAEAAMYRDLVAAHEALGQLLEVKDTMISHLLRERDSLQDELRQVVERYSAELSALDAQCQGYYQRLMMEKGDEGAGDGKATADSLPRPAAARASARTEASGATGALRGSPSRSQVATESGQRGDGRR